MATYIQGLTGNAPQIQQFKPDHNFYQSVLTLKQNQYDQGLQQVSSLYGSALDVELTRSDNKQKKQEFFDQIEGGIKKLAGLDLSLKQNVEQAYGLFNQFLHDESIQHDAWFTKTSNDELAKAKAFKNCINPDECGGEWWEGGERLIQLSLQEYRDATSQDALTMQPQEFIPAQNVWKIATDIVKEIDPDKNVEYIDESKTFVVKDKNGDVVTDEISALLTGILGSDPRIQQFYKAQAKLNRLEFVMQHKDEYGSIDIANAAYYGLAKQNEQKILEQQIQNTKNAINAETNANEKVKLQNLLKSYQEELKSHKENYKFLLGLANAVNVIQQVPVVTSSINEALGQPQANSTSMQKKIEEYMKMISSIDTALNTINSWYELTKQEREYVDGFSTDVLDMELANSAFILEVAQMTNPLSYIWSNESIKGWKPERNRTSRGNRSSSTQSGTPSSTTSDSTEISSDSYKYGGLVKYQKAGQVLPFDKNIIGVGERANKNPLHFSYFGNPDTVGTFNYDIKHSPNYGYVFKTNGEALRNMKPSDFMSDFEGYGYVIDKSGNASVRKMIVGHDSDGNPIFATGNDKKTDNETLEEYKQRWFEDRYGISYDEYKNAQDSEHPIYSVKLANMDADLSVYADLGYKPGKFSSTFLSLNQDGYENQYGGAEYNNPEKGIYGSSFNLMSFRGMIEESARTAWEDYETLYGTILKKIDEISQQRTEDDKTDYNKIRSFFVSKFDPEQFNVKEFINSLKTDIGNGNFFNTSYGVNISRMIKDDEKELLAETYSILFRNGIVEDYDNMVSDMSTVRQIAYMTYHVGDQIYDYINQAFDSFDNDFTELQKNKHHDLSTMSYDEVSRRNFSQEVANRIRQTKEYKEAGLIRNFMNYQRNSDNNPGEILFASCKNYQNLINNSELKHLLGAFSDEDINNPKEGDVSELHRGHIETSFTPIELALIRKVSYETSESGPKSLFKQVDDELSKIDNRYDSDENYGIVDLYIDNNGDIYFNQRFDRYSVPTQVHITNYNQDSDGNINYSIDVDTELTDEQIKKIQNSVNILGTRRETKILPSTLLETIEDMHSMMNNKEDRPDFEYEYYPFYIEASNRWQLEDLDEDTSYDREGINYIWDHVFGSAFKSGPKQLMTLYNSANLKTDYGSKVYGYNCDYSDDRVKTGNGYNLDKNINMSYTNDFIGTVLSVAGQTETPILAVRNKFKGKSYSPFPLIDGKSASNGDEVIKSDEEIKSALSKFYYDGMYKMNDKNKVEKFSVYVTPIANNDQRYIGISFKFYNPELNKGDNNKNIEDGGYDGYTFYVPVDDETIKRTKLVNEYRDNTLLQYISSTDHVFLHSDLGHSCIKFEKNQEDGKWYIQGNPWMEDWKSYYLNSPNGDDKVYKSEYGFLNNDVIVDDVSKVVNQLFLKDFFISGWTDEEFAYQYPELLKILDYNKRLRIKHDAELSKAMLNRKLKTNNQ